MHDKKTNFDQKKKKITKLLLILIEITNQD